MAVYFPTSQCYIRVCVREPIKFVVWQELTEGRVGGSHFHKEMPYAKILLSFFRNSQQVFCAWSAPQYHEQHRGVLLIWSHHPKNISWISLMLEESGLNLHSDRNCLVFSYLGKIFFHQEQLSVGSIGLAIHGK